MEPQQSGVWSSKTGVIAVLIILILGGLTAYDLYTYPQHPQPTQPALPNHRLDELSDEIAQLETAQASLSRQLAELSSNLTQLQAELGVTTAVMIYEEATRSVVSLKVGVREEGSVGLAQGSGFVFNEQGYIITNNHVVEGLDPQLGIEVVFMDGTAVEGVLVAADPYSDLAVLKAELPEGIRALQLGDSSLLKVGEPVVAIGNPFGLGGSLTTGVVSQTHRTLSTDGFLIPSVIQFDAAVNPGNSGGPLLNYQGEVVGVTTAGIGVAGQASGVGFAVPSNIVKKVATALIEVGEYRHPWIGFTGVPVSLKIAEAIGLNTTQGILVVEVVPDSPASRAGLKGGDRSITVLDETATVGGDVIVQVDGMMIKTFEDLGAYLEENTRPGDTIVLTVLRDNAKQRLIVTLEERP